VNICKTLGENIRSIRERTSMTQEKLALKADIDRPYLSFIEQGKRNPSIVIVGQIADALGVTPAELLKPNAQSNLPKK
jgi:transcriptional regulator with XRE-family HTH domain